MAATYLLLTTSDLAGGPHMLAAAATQSSGIDPTVTLGLGLMTLLGLTVAPIAVAWINRGGKSKTVDLNNLPADVVMPRRQYDELLDQFARADDANERIGKESTRLREQLDKERFQHALEIARLTALLGEKP